MNNDNVIQLSVVEITYLEDSSSPRSFVESIVTKDRRFLTEYEEKAKVKCPILISKWINTSLLQNKYIPF